MSKPLRVLIVEDSEDDAALVERELRRFDGGREIAEYIASTLDEDEIRRCGISAVVHKPFEIDELLQTTREVLLETASPVRPEETTGSRSA